MPLVIDISQSPTLKRLFDEGVRDAKRDVASDLCITRSETRGFIITDEARETIKSFTEAQSETFLDVLMDTKEFSTALEAAILVS